jgi:hypothetical protein
MSFRLSRSLTWKFYEVVAISGLSTKWISPTIVVWDHPLARRIAARLNEEAKASGLERLVKFEVRRVVSPLPPANEQASRVS